jgi:hypothetical protein
MRATLHGYRAGGFLLRPASDPHHHRPAIASTTNKRHRAAGRAKKTRGKQVAGAGMLMYVAREAPLQRVKLVYSPPSSRAQRKGRDQCGARYEISLLELEIAKTFENSLEE